MGAKGWMLLYSDEDIRSILQGAPRLDRDATQHLVTRLYPSHRLVPMDDATLEHTNPPDNHVYAGCFPGLTVVCTGEVALDRPSLLEQQFRDEAKGRKMYLHAMHSVVDWFAYGIWTGDGSLWRSLSLSPDSGVIEDIGNPLAFEAPYWAGKKPVEFDAEEPYPLPFHPLELAEDALRNLFGFNYEGLDLDDDPDVDDIVLAGYVIDAH